MAKVTSIKLKNFKSIGKDAQGIDLAPITLLFGPNSAGKSTLLQSLIYLREIICKGNLNPDQTELGGDWLDLGGFENLIHGHDLDEAIDFEVTLDLDNDELPVYLSEYEQEQLEEHGYPPVADIFEDLSNATISFSLRWSNSLNKVVIERYEVALNGQKVAVIEASLDGRQVTISKLPLEFSGFQSSLENLPDSLSLVETLNQLLSSSVIEQSTSQFGSGRPLISDSVEELEALINGKLPPSKKILEQLKEELSHRSTRRAHKLDIEVTKRLEAHGNLSEIEFLGLFDQEGALPSLTKGLTFDSEIWDEPEPTEKSEYALQRLVTSSLNSSICGPLKLLSDWLEELNYIGPLRDLPPRNIQSRTTPDKSRWAKGLAAWELLPTAKSSLIDEINFWLGDGCLDTGYQVLVKKYRELEDSHPLYKMLDGDMDFDDQLIIQKFLKELPHKVRVCLKEDISELEVMPHDIGVGISQLFPVIALSVIQQKGLVAIEQPELHIHPKLQVELADVFVRYAKQNNTIFLLETHSEHLMLRLLRRVRQSGDDSSEASKIDNSLEPGDLSVNYVEPTDTGTKFRRLRITEDGDFLDEWPSGFFDERDEELFF